MGHIFISYSHKDSTYVHKLAEALEQEGFEVWIDDRIHYGSEWPRVVTRNLDLSDGVIVVLSKNSYESDMVQNEVARVREKKKPIFPVLLDGDNWLIVQAKQFVDARDGSLPPEKFYKRLEEITPRKNEKAEREAVEKARSEAEELTKQKTAREKTERDLIEKVAGDDVAGEQALHEAKEKALSESMPRENAVIDRLIKSKREEAENVAREKEEKEIAKKAWLEAEEQIRQKAAKEKAKSDADEKATHKKITREAAEKAVPKIAPVNEEKQANILIPKVDKSESKKIKTPNKGLFSIIAVILVICVSAGFIINLVAQNISTPPHPTQNPNIANIERTAAAYTVVAEFTLTAAAFTPTLLPPTETRTATPTTSSIQSAFGAPGVLCDNLSFDATTVDVTILDGTLMAPGQEFVKTWKVKNVGICAWDGGYGPVFSYGEKMNGQPVPLDIWVQVG